MVFRVDLGPRKFLKCFATSCVFLIIEPRQVATKSPLAFCSSAFLSSVGHEHAGGSANRRKTTQPERERGAQRSDTEQELKPVGASAGRVKKRQ